MIPLMETPREVREMAARKGLTVAALCRKAGLPSSAWHRWNKGAATTVVTVQKMLDAISATPDKQTEGDYRS